ncbi:MAG: cation:proton antiporter, partial [Bacteroidota bacterium]
MILLLASPPELINFVLLGLCVIVVGMILRRFRQPYIIAYMLAGTLMGQHGMSILTDENVIQTMGEFGLILLLFFIGMEISLPNLIKNWKVPIVGTLLQISGSILLLTGLGWFFEWGINQTIVLGFVTSLSSSAVVIKLLQDNHEFHTAIGQNVISILIMQDILIVPMLIVTSQLGGGKLHTHEIALQIVGGLLMIGLIAWLIRKKNFTLPFVDKFKDDHELQVMIAFIFCFGFALVTALFGLSAALGAFVGGIFVNAANATEWFHDSLHSFRVVFVALFFVSVGMLIDLDFLTA